MSTYTIPNVIARTTGGERIMDVYSHLLTERIVYLGTAIDSGVANALIAQLLHLEADNPEQEIALYINSEGGDLSAMLAVYDTMRFIKAPVATTCIGQAVATGAVLLDTTASADAGVDIVSSEYAVVAAEQTALERLSKDIADQIVARLALLARAQKSAQAPQ